MSVNPKVHLKQKKILTLKQIEKIQKNKDIQTLWIPQPGSQTAFISCPVPECLFEGTRGSGKTDTLLIDFVQHVGKGAGVDYRGVLFRHTYKQLNDVVVKSTKLFSNLFFFDHSGQLRKPKFNKSSYTWYFPQGEELILTYMKRIEDYNNHHGHEYSWIAFEELTNWPTSDCYDSMKGSWRSTSTLVPRKFRSTTNPFGVGHNWVKKYFIDPAPAGQIIEDEIITPNGKKIINKRVRISSSIIENEILKFADPTYISKLYAISNPNKRKAWLHGSWEIVAGGAISDIWTPSIHVVEPFEVPVDWRIDRCFDWGSSKPYAILYFAESDGTTPAIIKGQERYFPKGTTFIIDEVYGCDKERVNTGVYHKPKKIAQVVMDYDAKWQSFFDKQIRAVKAMLIDKGFQTQYDLNYLKKIKKKKVIPGAADSSIWDGSRGKSIAEQMREWKVTEGVHEKVVKGVEWEKSDRSPGSRIAGLELFRDMLDNSIEPFKDSNGFVDLTEETTKKMELPGFFVFNTCRDWIRTVPVIPRDERNLDDADSDGEDHLYDVTRYKVLDLKNRGLRIQGF